MKFILLIIASIFLFFSVSIIAEEFPITNIGKNYFRIKGHAYKYESDNKPYPFEIGQTFIIESEEIVPLSEHSYQLLIGLTSPVTKETKYFESTMNSFESGVAIKEAVETDNRQEWYWGGGFTGRAGWTHNIFLNLTAEDNTVYQILIISIDSNREVARNEAETMKQQIIDDVNKGGLIKFGEHYCRSPFTWFSRNNPDDVGYTAYFEFNTSGFNLMGPFRRFSSEKLQEDDLIFDYYLININGPKITLSIEHFGDDLRFIELESKSLSAKFQFPRKFKFIKSDGEGKERIFIFEDLTSKKHVKLKLL